MNNFAFLGIETKPQDAWLGAYWKDIYTADPDGSRKRVIRHLWVCLLPCLPLHFRWEFPR